MTNPFFTPSFVSTGQLGRISRFGIMPTTAPTNINIPIWNVGNAHERTIILNQLAEPPSDAGYLYRASSPIIRLDPPKAPSVSAWFVPGNHQPAVKGEFGTNAFPFSGNGYSPTGEFQPKGSKQHIQHAINLPSATRASVDIAAKHIIFYERIKYNLTQLCCYTA
jgi:hypothetical protein